MRPPAHDVFTALVSELTVSWLYLWLVEQVYVGMRPYQKLLKQEGTARWIESMQQSSATPSLHLGFWGLWKILACSQSSSQCLLVSIVFGTVSSLHPTSFLMIFTLVPPQDWSINIVMLPSDAACGCNLPHDVLFGFNCRYMSIPCKHSII